MASDWTGTYTWRVENWTQLIEENIYSPEFEVGGYTWRLLVFQREASFTPVQMCPRVRFQLMAVKTNAPKESLEREATHTFTNQAANWGFTQFMSIQEAQNPQNGYLVNDTLTLCVKIYLEEMDSVLGTISKLETGFIGIKSSKETGLLSSYLQCLFHIKAFRKLVFQMPTLASDDSQKSVPLALQHLFYNLQYQNRSAKTKDLIKALDWDCNDLCLQCNVPEIQRTLFGTLGEEDKACSIKNCISDLILGEYSSYNECPTIPEAPIHKHTYKAIPLDVLECRDVYASLEKFCQTMRFDEDNHYLMTNHGPLEAKEYVLFDSFPTVLQFNLKRCYYNSDRNVILKMNSHYEFYDELDMDYNDRVLLSKNSDTTTENKYRLHSVLVHRGGPRGGHYFAFIRRNEKWYKFDGEVVKAVSAEEAINAQFGDRNGTSSANFSKGFESINKSAAVMLIYIRKSEWNAVMCDAGKQYLPEQVRDNFDSNRMCNEEERKEKEEAHLYVNIKLATESHFARQKCERGYFDLVDFDAVKKYRIYKKTPFEHFKEMVSKDFGIPIHLQRFWLWSKRQNNTMRVSEPLIESNIDIKTVLDLKHYRDESSPPDQEKTALMTIKLFLESPEKAAIARDTLHPIHRNEILIFLKYYDPELSKLSFLGHMFVEKTCPFGFIFEKAKKMAGVAPDEEVIGLEEDKCLPEVVCSDLVPNTTPERTQMFHGDIVIIQKRANKIHYEHPTVRSFLEFIRNIVIVTFRTLKDRNNEGFKLRLLKTLSYEQVTNALAKHLQVDDPKKLRLTEHNVHTCMPQERPIKYNGIECLQQMILHATEYTRILYYEVLDVQLPYLESIKRFRIGFHNAKGEWQSEHHLRVSKDHKVSDLVKALKEEWGEEYNDCDMRIMGIVSSKVSKLLDPDSELQQVCEEHDVFRAEVIPEDQKKLKSDEFLVQFCHCKRWDNWMMFFGDPLLVKVKKGETVREVRARIQKTLEIPDEEFSRWRFAYRTRLMHRLKYLRDSDEILAKFRRTAINGRTNGKLVGDNCSCIALQHEDARFNQALNYISDWLLQQ